MTNCSSVPTPATLPLQRTSGGGVGPWCDPQAGQGHAGSARGAAGGGKEGRVAWPPGARREDICRTLSLEAGTYCRGDRISTTGPYLLPHTPLKSVFKNYDPEGRGTISQEDFERLSGNFPFACHGLHPPPRQG